MDLVSIFLGDLSYFCTEQDLVNLISPLGEIKSVIVRRGRTGDTLHYAFVKMVEADAKAVISQLQGTTFLGRKLRVGINVPNQPQMNQVSHDGRVKWAQIYVNFQSKTMKKQVNEELLQELFSRAGTVADCVVKHYVLEGNPRRQSGYGFVYFESADDAKTAVEQFKQQTIEGILFDCNICAKDAAPQHQHHQHQQMQQMQLAPESGEDSTRNSMSPSTVPPSNSGSFVFRDSSGSLGSPSTVSLDIPHHYQQHVHTPRAAFAKPSHLMMNGSFQRSYNGSPAGVQHGGSYDYGTSTTPTYAGAPQSPQVYTSRSTSQDSYGPMNMGFVPMYHPHMVQMMSAPPAGNANAAGASSSQGAAMPQVPYGAPMMQVYHQHAAMQQYLPPPMYSANPAAVGANGAYPMQAMQMQYHPSMVYAPMHSVPMNGTAAAVSPTNNYQGAAGSSA